MGHRTMIMMSSVFLLLLLLPGYVLVDSVKSSENSEASETSCVASLINGRALMVFATSTPSFAGVNFINIVCEYVVGRKDNLLELDLSDISEPKITSIEKDVVFHDIVRNLVAVSDRNASRASGCYMDHTLAFHAPLRHKCQLIETDAEAHLKDNQDLMKIMQKILNETTAQREILEKVLNKSQAVEPHDSQSTSWETNVIKYMVIPLAVIFAFFEIGRMIKLCVGQR